MQIEMQQSEARGEEATPTPTSQGLLFVLSAPSGAGKDTVIQAMQAQGADFFVVPSVTTRAPRPGESEGKPYYFVDLETFERMVAGGELLEHAKVHGNWYGQPRQPIRDNLLAGRDVLLKIDVQGAASVRRLIPQAVFISFIQVPAKSWRKGWRRARLKRRKNSNGGRLMPKQSWRSSTGMTIWFLITTVVCKKQ